MALLVVFVAAFAHRPALAEEPVREARSTSIDHVVELFTSQGCRSCPPAERLLGTIEGEGVLTLAYHVDYWDYIGWRDTYGSKANTARQEAYGESFDLLSLSTPQLVVNGRRQITGAGAEQVHAMLKATPKLDRDAATVSARVSGENLKIKAAMTRGSDGEWPLPVVILVTYDDHSTTRVTGGENLGTDLAETHPVRDWQILGAWAGEPMKISLPLSTVLDGAKKESGCAVLVQMMSKTGEPGPILAAARVDLSDVER